MPEPEKVDASSQPLATGMQQQSYKCLLNQQVQKLRKQAPVYQTHNEGYEHQPKFRTTIWVDGVSYTSPNTFQHRKLAEIDASKITLFAIMHKLKNEALHHVLEDKTFCKSILVEYAVRMDIQKPTYQTTQLGSSVPLFRSSLVFNDASFTGDDCRTKKEAEQSAARAVILKYLDSETGIILSEIIKSKFNHTLTKDIQIAQNDTNVVNGLVALNEAKSNEGTKIPHTEPLHITTTTTPATNPPVDIITQTHTQETPTIPVPTVPTYSPPLMTPQIPTQPPTQTTQTTPVSTVLAQTPLTPSIQTPTQTTPVHIQTPVVGTTYSAPSVGHYSNVVQQGTTNPVTTTTQTVSMPTVVAQTPTQAVLMPTVVAQAPTQTVSMPTVMSQAPTPAVLAQTNPISVRNNAPISAAAPSLGNFVSIPATQPSNNNVVQPINSEAPVPPVTVVSSLPISTPITGKKRNRKNKKNTQKRIRAENQLAVSAMFHGQVPTFSAQ